MFKVCNFTGTYTHLRRSGSSTELSKPIPKSAHSLAIGAKVSSPILLAITLSVSTKQFVKLMAYQSSILAMDVNPESNLKHDIL